MRILFKQTVLLFSSLLIMISVTAGIFFIFVKKSETKNRALVSGVLSTPVVDKNIDILSETKDIIITTTTIEEKKEEISTTTEEIKKIEEKKEEVKNTTTTVVVVTGSDKVLWDVPFTSQAPFGDWSDPRQDAGCEESSLLMAVHWITGKPLTPSIALKEITAMSDFELERYGNFYDTSAADTLKLFKDYFGYKNAYVKYDIGLEDVKKALKAGNVVQVPVAGIALGNPYFTAPGPPVHQLLIIGYDDTTREFITNDPGTRHGKGYRYKYSVMMGAIGDYPTGHNEVDSTHIPAMLVISKNQD